MCGDAMCSIRTGSSQSNRASPADLGTVVLAPSMLACAIEQRQLAHESLFDSVWYASQHVQLSSRVFQLSSSSRLCSKPIHTSNTMLKLCKQPDHVEREG